MSIKDHNINESIEYYKGTMPKLFEKILVPIVSQIVKGDGMFRPLHPNNYVLCGLNAVQNILQALNKVNKDIEDIKDVLDFACGYGRVARVLRATFPKSNMTVCDLDKKAVKAVESILKVNAVVGDVDLNRIELNQKFDLIWVGSLFTHVDKKYAKELISFFSNQLKENGVLVFTTHGKFVANRIRNNERSYNLSESNQKTIINEFDINGYGFSTYPKQHNYGISIVKKNTLIDMVVPTDNLQHIFYKERGWVKHQDVFAFQKTALHTNQ